MNRVLEYCISIVPYVSNFRIRVRIEDRRIGQRCNKNHIIQFRDSSSRKEDPWHSHFKEFFGVPKPVIAMAHIPALSGTPRYDPALSVEPDLSTVQQAKAAVGGQVPMLLNTGARKENIRPYLGAADGVIVGSSLKVDGKTWNPVDPARVKAFMEEVRDVRKDLS